MVGRKIPIRGESRAFFSLRSLRPLAAKLGPGLLAGLAVLPCGAATQQPKLTKIAPKAGLVIVNWTNGTVPFQVQCCTRLGSTWQDVGGKTSAFSQTNILAQPAAFYRVVSVAAQSDTTAPTIPANLTASAASPSQINLSWGGSSDSGSGVKGYNVYRNGICL